MYSVSLFTKRCQPLLISCTALFSAIILSLTATGAFASGGGYFLSQFTTINTIATTVPAQGDVNPYGVSVVPHSVGKLVVGDILVSNFNNAANLQGTGTTIVQIAPNGVRSLFARINPSALHGSCPGGVGLTTALTVLKRGWVIVGSLPATGTPTSAKPGCLLILDSYGHQISTIVGYPIDGPWNSAMVDNGSWATLFVSNVLLDTVRLSPHVVKQGIVTRIELKVPYSGSNARLQVESETVIGKGFSERTDPMALVVGPTGLGLDSNGTLYVSDTVNNRIAAIPHALVRSSAIGNGGYTVTANGLLNGPLGLAIAPNGDILTTNGGDGFIVETTPFGQQVASFLLNNTGSPPGAGCLFGFQAKPDKRGIYYVDDCSNTLNVLH